MRALILALMLMTAPAVMAQSADENAKLRELVTLYEQLLEGKQKELELVTNQLTKERDFYKENLDKEKETTRQLTIRLRSCTGRFLGLFRICRL